MGRGGEGAVDTGHDTIYISKTGVNKTLRSTMEGAWA